MIFVLQLTQNYQIRNGGLHICDVEATGLINIDVTYKSRQYVTYKSLLYKYATMLLNGRGYDRFCFVSEVIIQLGFILWHTSLEIFNVYFIISNYLSLESFYSDMLQNTNIKSLIIWQQWLSLLMQK